MSELARKYVHTAVDYNSVVSSLFEDKFSTGRGTVFVLFSHAVRYHLPLDQRGQLNHYFWRWVSKLERELPQENWKAIKEKWIENRMTIL